MSAHARFSPSSAHRWMACPGSIALTRDIPDGGSSHYAELGTAAHLLASRALEHGEDAAFFKGVQLQARLDSPVFVVDDEMIQAVQVYLDEVRSRADAGDELLIEQKLEFSDAIGVPGQFGTGDAVILHKDEKRITVIDYKHGQGVRVEAYQNPQLLTYALAAIETYAPLIDLDMLETATVVVVQPRMDHIDEYTATVAELKEFGRKLALSARHAQKGLACLDAGQEIPPELFTPTDKGCRWCSAKLSCKALERMIASTVFDDFEALADPAALVVQPEPRPPVQSKLGETFGVLDLIEGWCRAVRAEVERQVAAGMTVIGPDGLPMKLIEGRKGHRAWLDEQAAEGVLTGLIPPEKAYIPRKLISPSQAGKLLNKKKTQELWKTLEPLIVQPPGKAKVAQGSDPAPPYTGTAGADDFTDLDGD